MVHRRQGQGKEEERYRREKIAFFFLFKKGISLSENYLESFSTAEDIFSKHPKNASFSLEINKSVNYNPPGFPKILQERTSFLDIQFNYLRSSPCCSISWPMQVP